MPAPKRTLTRNLASEVLEQTLVQLSASSTLTAISDGLIGLPADRARFGDPMAHLVKKKAEAPPPSAIPQNLVKQMKSGFIIPQVSPLPPVSQNDAL